MSDHRQPVPVTKPPKSFGWMAEYADEHSLLAASRKVRDSGYTKTDAYTPYPVHGIDEALGIKPTILPFIVICGGFTGLFTALVMQYWMNAVDYPYIISGKPFASWPAFIPVSFELTILLSAFSTFFGMWFLNFLPRFSNPLFTNPKFDRVTDDRFFLHVDSADKYYNRESVQELLSGTQPLSLDEVVEDSTPDQIPSVIWYGLLALGIAALIPLSIVLNMRASNSPLPRWHVFFDMDFQPKKKSQQTTTIFADGRTIRPQIIGTIARGQLGETDAYYLGYYPDDSDEAEFASLSRSNRTRLVLAQDEETDPAPAEEATSDEVPADEVTEVESTIDSSTDAPQTEESDSGDATEEDSVAQVDSELEIDASSGDSTGEGDETQNADADSVADSASDAEPEKAFVKDFPVDVTAEMLALGKLKYETYCAVCHGYAGDGDGLVHRRADQLQQGYWLPPTSLHEQRIRDQAVGNIYYTIANGKGKMAGYGAILNPKERWAITMYVRALQRSRNASESDIPAEKLETITEVTKTN